LYQADVRVIAATNTDLERALTEGKIRQDLFYRLNIISFKIPSLQERQRDIPLLVKYFIEKYAIEFDKKVTGIDASALNILMFHHWPGNVRELEHVIERAVLFSKQPEIGENDIIIPLKKASFCTNSFKEAKADVVNKFEKRYIKNLLLACQGNITKAAQAAQKNRRAFWQLIRKHHIDVHTFKP
jgi:two-component system response regulator GlrR